MLTYAELLEFARISVAGAEALQQTLLFMPDGC
jgi:hypothetical protein